MHGFRQRRGLRRGLVPTVIPFTGYGTTELGPGARAGRAAQAGDAAAPIGRRQLPRLAQLREHPGQRGARRAWWSTARGPRSDPIGAECWMPRIPAQLAPGWAVVSLGIAGDEVEAPVFVVGDGVRFGVISDVDDTVMVTALPRPFLAAWNTFVVDEHARRPVAGMAVLYDRLRQQHPGCPGDLPLHRRLERRADAHPVPGRNVYPGGALLLTDWGPTHDRWFRNGQEHKAKQPGAAGSGVPDRQLVADRRRRPA